MRRAFVVALAVSWIGAWPAFAQQSPFVSDQVYRLLVNEISGDVAYEMTTAAGAPTCWKSLGRSRR